MLSATLTVDKESWKGANMDLASAAELSGCAQAVWPSESNIYTLALFRKPLRSPALNNESDAHVPIS